MSFDDFNDSIPLSFLTEYFVPVESKTAAAPKSITILSKIVKSNMAAIIVAMYIHALIVIVFPGIQRAALHYIIFFFIYFIIICSYITVNLILQSCDIKY